MAQIATNKVLQYVFLTLALLIQLTSLPAQAQIGPIGPVVPTVPCPLAVLVTPSGAGSQDGTSWANAYAGTALQAAINQAFTCGSDVWVAAGVYKPTTGTNRNTSFSLKEGVGIYGGFAGTEATLTGPTGRTLTYPFCTTLSGEIGDPASTTDNSLHVVYNYPGLTTAAILDGFVITAGNAGSDSGGGMLNKGNGTGNSCRPLIRNCAFLGNQANSGGAMYNGGSFGGNSSPTLINCLFQGNRGTSGGAIFNGGDNTGVSSPTLTNCAFLANSATSAGGALYNGGNLNGQSSPVLTNCSFQENRATGGSVLLNDGRSAGSSQVRLLNCALFDNGGNITFFNLSASVTATYSLFEASVAGYSGANNLTVSTSPFASASTVALHGCSPAINAGDPATNAATGAPAAVGTTDLAQNPRFFNSSIIDMGAVEYQGANGTPTSYSVMGSGTATCAGSPTVTLSSSETGVSYQLQRGGTNTTDNPQPGTGSALVFGPQSTSGVYTVVATRTSGGCTAVMAQSATVVSNTAVPTVSIAPTSGTLTCTQTAIVLTAVSSTTGLLWSNVATTTSITVNSTGMYSVTATGMNGCTAVSNAVVIGQDITAPTSPALTSNFNGTLTCAQTSLTLTASATGSGLSYAFAGPSGAVGSGFPGDNTRPVSASGLYSVTITGGNGCTASTSTTIFSTGGAAASTPMLNASSSVVCQGSAVQVVATVSGPLTGSQWYNNGQAVSGQTSATLNLSNLQTAQSGSYALIVTGTNCGTVTSLAFALTVNPFPTVVLIFPNNANVQGSTISLPAPLTGVSFQAFGGTSYERFIIIDRINGFEIRQVDQNTNGIFNVNRTGPFSLTVTGQNGCKRTVEGVITNLPAVGR